MANDTLINLLAWCKRERERLQMQREMLQSGRFRIFEKDDSDQQRDISNQHIEQIAANISEIGLSWLITKQRASSNSLMFANHRL